MTELKPVEIALKILQKVKEENTGSREELAQYLGITPAWVTKYIRKIESELKVQIAYNRRRCSYLLNEDDHHKLPPPLFKMILNIAYFVRESVGIPNRVIFDVNQIGPKEV
jgi:predicted ArsR family transcriptional regulator